MSRRTVATLAILAVVVVAILGTLPVAQAGEVIDVTGNDDVEILTGESDETTIEVSTIDNTGEEEEADDVDADISVDDTGLPFDVEETTVTIPPGDTETVNLEVDVDDDADPDTYSVSGDVNGEPFSFDVTVESQPPLPGFEDEPLDAGDILVGETVSDEFVVEELGGDEGLDGVEWDIVSDDPDADLSFDDLSSSGGWGGSDGVQTDPGGEDTAEWEVSVDDDADQHESLSWTVDLWDENNPDEAREVDVEANVIYPGYYGTLEFEETMVFDEPRDENDVITQTLELDVPNDGDEPLEVGSIRGSASNADISVDTENVPDEIDAQSSETIDVVVAADTDLSEGEYDFSATASADDVDTDDGTYDGDIEIIHETELTVESVSIGEVAIGESEQVATELKEELGYNDIDDLELAQDEGPDEWLVVEEEPTSLSAGETDDVVFDLEFDTDAELGENYEWVHTADGDGVEAESISVSASPVPLDLDPIRDDLSGHSGPVADGTLEMVETMDEQMQAGEADDDDISTVLTFGSASTLYLDAAEEANELVDDDDHEEAQAEIVQSSAAYNTMTLYADQIEGDQQRDDSEAILETAEADLEELIDAQEAHYEQRLESGELSLLEEATIQRELARIALLQGDDERADALESDAESAFEEYSEAVSDGEGAAQSSEDTWQTMESEQFVTVLGQPLMVNPAEYDTFTDRTDELHDSYDASVTAFEDAGESSRAEVVASEHEDRSGSLTIAQTSLFVATGVYGLVAIGIVTRISRRMYWYLRDARESVTGDFLM
ncbi:hypothetical protein G6M89_08045 [Natronolimnobius sp. AArcel1]|uniref:hypothetical protein n=1 Tax=Natronolimnobius sp. AArcel1 TaxID=1679093 RepID=UPI0013EC4556|nr:hypothetical protein [Natronolimnobius sp. AArcel1]NGM68963.1 hypothetical protein [Natronolimnobius sp. AArcel1]